MCSFKIFLMSFILTSFVQANASSEALVFRIADEKSYAKEGDLGHCSGFLFQDQLYTAGHCNHLKPIFLVTQKGKIFLDLKDNEKFYLKNSFGLLDVVTMKLQPQQVQVIKDNAEKIQLSSKGAQIIGYPIFLRAEKATVFNCDVFYDKKLNYRHQLERAIDNTHHSCSQANNLPGVNTQTLTHSDVKGLSGGLLAVDGEIKGVVYHYDEPRGDFSIGVYKSILLNDEQLMLSEAGAIQGFGLGKKLFEEVKQPNRSIMALEAFLTNDLKLKNGYLVNIDNIVKTPQGWRILFLDGTTFDFEDSKVSDSIRTLLML